MQLDAELVGRLLDALVAELVERLVVEAARVGDDARQEVARCASVPVPLPVSSSGASPHAASVAVASSATRPPATTFLVFLTDASKITSAPGMGPHIG